MFGLEKVQLYTRRKSLARCSRDIKSITSLQKKPLVRVYIYVLFCPNSAL